MKAAFWGLTGILISLCIAAPAEAGKEIISLATDPPHATALVYISTPKYKELGTCETPCQLTIKTKTGSVYDYTVLFTKDNYVAAEMRGEAGVSSQKSKRFFQVLENTQAVIDQLEKESHELARKALEKCWAAVSAKAYLDRDIVPCRNIPPLSPPRQEENGYCEMTYDVNAEGFTENIAAKICTHERLKRASETALRKWLFLPKIQNGTSVAAPNQNTKFKFVILPDDGFNLRFKTRQFIVDFKAWNEAALARDENGTFDDINDGSFEALLDSYCVPQGDRFGAVISSHSPHDPRTELIENTETAIDTGSVFTADTDDQDYVTHYRYDYRRKNGEWCLMDLSFKDEDGQYLSLIWKTKP